MRTGGSSPNAVPTPQQSDSSRTLLTIDQSEILASDETLVVGHVTL